MQPGDELAAELGRRMIERRDVKAAQQANGAYHPVTDSGKPDGQRLPFKMSDLRDHVAGTRTYGHYLVSPEGNCRVFCFDIDLRKPDDKLDPPYLPEWEDEAGLMHRHNPRETWLDDEHPARMDLGVKLRCMAEGLARCAHRLLDIPVAVAYSGNKGLHVYGFVGSNPAGDVRACAQEVLDSLGCFEASRGANFFRHVDPASGYADLEIEIYPKQDTLDGKDLGNLLRLPMGVNQKSGNEGFFLDIDAEFWPFKPDDPMRALTVGSVR